MDADMQFGELEESAPEVQLRPDANKHYCVVPYESPDPSDLPIFVDMDVMRDMEAHAQSDTSVELGGVLLGGQYQDEDGRAFVVVTDSLRAQHYESTKGSFKFTHDTWTQITREREQFPDELQMVGWYHTHPDWGVFLSGMDMFICDNFFNRPLDIALVIDPCRLDRGMFQWTGDPGERIRRTGGFYLTASRFRRQELELFAAQLEGKHPMSHDPRSPVPPAAGAMPAPVVNISEARSPWLPLAVMSMLSMQFLLVALIAWRMISPSASAPAASEVRQAEVEQQRALLDEIIAKMGEGPNGLATSLEEQRAENERLAAELAGLHFRVQQLQQQRDNAVAEQQILSDAYKDLERSFAKLDEREQSQRKEIERLKIRLATFEDGKPERGFSQWTWIGIGTAAAIVLLGGIFVLMRKSESEDKEDAEDELDEANT